MFKTKIAAIAVGAVTLASSFALTSTEANATNYGRVFAYGATAFVLGTIVASQYNSYPVYVAKKKHCELVPVYQYGYIVSYQKQCWWL